VVYIILRVNLEMTRPAIEAYLLEIAFNERVIWAVFHKVVQKRDFYITQLEPCSILAGKIAG